MLSKLNYVNKQFLISMQLLWYTTDPHIFLKFRGGLYLIEVWMIPKIRFEYEHHIESMYRTSRYNVRRLQLELYVYIYILLRYEKICYRFICVYPNTTRLYPIQCNKEKITNKQTTDISHMYSTFWTCINETRDHSFNI